MRYSDIFMDSTLSSHWANEARDFRPSLWEDKGATFSHKPISGCCLFLVYYDTIHTTIDNKLWFLENFDVHDTEINTRASERKAKGEPSWNLVVLISTEQKEGKRIPETTYFTRYLHVMSNLTNFYSAFQKPWLTSRRLWVVTSTSLLQWPTGIWDTSESPNSASWNSSWAGRTASRSWNSIWLECRKHASSKKRQ